MPTVESEIVIERPVAEVYALAQDIERFPEFMAKTTTPGTSSASCHTAGLAICETSST